ncbi:MAG: RNA-binding protein [Armatimonadetes bacterium]|nr:RNA-binding protein [Armatimonadota bacterium]
MATKTLFVGNLPYSISENELLEHFAKFSPSNARIIAQRGFGFIDVDADQMTEAINETNMKDLGGRTIAVNEAQPRSSGGGGGGRSSGNGYGRGRR